MPCYVSILVPLQTETYQRDEMKKVILAILLSINPITASQIKYLKVDKKELTLITQPYDIYDSEGELVKFYVEQKNNDLDFLFSLIL